MSVEVSDFNLKSWLQFDKIEEQCLKGKFLMVFCKLRKPFPDTSIMFCKLLCPVERKLVFKVLAQRGRISAFKVNEALLQYELEAHSWNRVAACVRSPFLEQGYSLCSKPASGTELQPALERRFQNRVSLWSKPACGTELQPVLERCFRNRVAVGPRLKAVWGFISVHFTNRHIIPFYNL